MVNSNIEIQLGHIAGQQDMVLLELSCAREDRKEQTNTISEIQGSVLTLNNRMTTVENKLTTFSPTIDEFIQIKNKVIGAGKIGKWLWLLLVALIGLIFKFRMELAAWYAK